MASIPTYLYLGGPNLLGVSIDGLVPQPGVSGNLWLNAFNSPKLMQNVPTDGASFRSFWDGKAGTQLTITGATANTVTVSGSPWTADSEVGKTVRIDTGAAHPIQRKSMIGVVSTNTTNQVTVVGTWESANPEYWALNPLNPTDGKLHIEDGAWVYYNALSGRDVYSSLLGPLRDNYGTNGDNWFGGEQGGFGATASLMQELKEEHPTAPFFRLFKYGNVGGMGNWGNPSSGVWLDFVAEWEKAVAAATADGDTLVPRAVVIDASIADIINQNANFLLHTITFVSSIRTLLSDPSVPVFMHSHASGLYSGPTLEGGSLTTTPDGLEVPYSRLIRGYTNKLRALITNFRTIDWEGSEFSARNFLESFGLPPTVYPGTQPVNPVGYSTSSHLAIGVKVARAIAGFYADLPTGSPGGGIPLVVMLGDSQGLTTGQSPFIAILGGQASLLGSTSGSTIMGSHRIWDGQSESWEPFDLAANSNTVIEATPEYYGPDATLFRRLKDAFPNGCLLFKAALGGSSITMEAATGFGTWDPTVPDNLWDQMSEQWSKSLLACTRDLHLTPETIAGCLLLGDNDCNPAGSAALATKLETFIATFRTLFRTRPIELGDDLLVVSHLPPEHADNGGQSIHGDAASRTSVRQTFRNLATADSRLLLLSDEGLELRREVVVGTPDYTHYAGEAVHLLGTRFGDAIISGQSAAGSGAGGSGSLDAGADSVSGGPDTPGADLVVEDGSGLATADSYLSLVEAEVLADAAGGPAVWVAATDAQKNAWLRQAAAGGIDLMFSLDWSGTPSNDTQALLWPRWGAYNRARSRVVAANVIPQEIKRMQFEFAIALSNGIDPLRTIDPLADRSVFATSTTDKLPGGFEESRTYAEGGGMALAVVTRLQLLAEAFLCDTNSVGLA